MPKIVRSLDEWAGIGPIAEHPRWAGVLMVEPSGFDVLYAINPHMTDQDGHMKRPDTGKAQAQWERVRGVYEHLGFPVSVLKGVPGLPDMVFAANQSLPFLDSRSGEPCVLLSRMRHEQRAAEVPHFARWYEEHGYRVVTRAPEAPFLEGHGDILWMPGQRLLLGGCGFRTEPRALTEVATAMNVPMVAVQLVDERWYHLDTAISPLSAHAALWVEDAFDERSKALLRAVFDELIPVPHNEAVECLGANAHCVDGHSVLIEATAVETRQALIGRGFEVFPLETSEFLKAGGSVFCMKAMLPAVPSVKI